MATTALAITTDPPNKDISCLPIPPPSSEATAPATTPDPKTPKRKSANWSSSKKKKKTKTKTPEPKKALAESYHFGDNGAKCDVCFFNESNIIKPNPLIQCRSCNLLVHDACYDTPTPVDASGYFLCDVCHLTKKISSKKNKIMRISQGEEIKIEKDVKDNSKEEDSKQGSDAIFKLTHVPLPILLPDAEAKDDGRVYPYKQEIDTTENNNAHIENLNDFHKSLLCVFCLRADVAGGLKQSTHMAGVGKVWAHLSCTLSTQHCHYSLKGKVAGISQALKSNQEEIEEEWHFLPKCEICNRSGGYLMNCTHVSEKSEPMYTTKYSKKGKIKGHKLTPWVDRRCHKFFHPLCAELGERERVIAKDRKGKDDVILYKCAEHSGYEKCVICDSAVKPNEILECDGCKLGYHLHCLDPPLREVPEGDWFCDKCMDEKYGERCNICKSRDRPHEMLECDGCRLGFHLDCLDPALTEIPEGDWFCKTCKKKKKTK